MWRFAGHLILLIILDDRVLLMGSNIEDHDGCSFSACGMPAIQHNVFHIV